MKLFGYKNRTLQLRKAPQEESGKYEIFELAIVDEEFDAVGSVGVCFRSDEVKNPLKAEVPEAPAAVTTE